MLPEFPAEYSGDVLWAMMVYFIMRTIFVKKPEAKCLIYALCFSFLIEFSQLYQTGWINDIRNIKMFGLILGYGFLWNDLVCYTIGIITAYLFDKKIMFRIINSKK